MILILFDLNILNTRHCVITLEEVGRRIEVIIKLFYIKKLVIIRNKNCACNARSFIERNFATCSTRALIKPAKFMFGD